MHIWERQNSIMVSRVLFLRKVQYKNFCCQIIELPDLYDTLKFKVSWAVSHSPFSLSQKLPRKEGHLQNCPFHHPFRGGAEKGNGVICFHSGIKLCFLFRFRKHLQTNRAVSQSCYGLLSLFTVLWVLQTLHLTKNTGPLPLPPMLEFALSLGVLDIFV